MEVEKQRSIYLFGPYFLDPAAGLFRDERLVPLPPKELALLTLLVSSSGQVVAHKVIETQVWPNQVVSYGSLARCVYSLRRLLGEEGKLYIATVAKRGYRLTVPVRWAEPTQLETIQSKSLSSIALAYSHFMAGSREANDPRPAAQSRAVLLYEEASRVDPQFASAFAAVADTRMYQLIRGFLHPRDGLELGLKACHRALKINPLLVQGMAALSWFEGAMMGRFNEAHATLDKALSIDPGYSRGHMYRSWLFRCQGQPAASIESAQRALDHDPHALLNRHSYCWALFCGGQIEKALEMERSLRREYPRDDIAHGYVALMAAYANHMDEAQEASTETLELSSDIPAVCAAMAYVYARLGKNAEALKLAEQAEAAALPRAPRPMLAPVYVELGDPERALALLREAREEGCAWLLLARFDPRLAALQAEDRFCTLFDTKTEREP